MAPSDQHFPWSGPRRFTREEENGYVERMLTATTWAAMRAIWDEVIARSPDDGFLHELGESTMGHQLQVRRREGIVERRSGEVTDLREKPTHS